MNITFRYSTDADAKYFADVLLGDTDGIFKLSFSGNREDLFRNDSYHTCFTAYEDSSILGFVRLQAPDVTGFNYIADIYVLPDHRRKGVGTKLIQFAEKYTFENWMACGVDLYTIDNKPMEKLVKKLGYIQGGYDKKRYFRAGKFQGQKRWYKLYELKGGEKNA